MDTIQNEGTIRLVSQSTLVSESRSYKLFGVGIADADSKAESIATGIDGGSGNNTIDNFLSGSITVSSNASATATGMTANIGVAGASASTTSKAHSTGIKSGDGEDTIYNYGNMNVTATSSTRAGGGFFSLVGLSFGDSLTEAIAEGINAGGGNDTIINAGPITVGSVQDNDHPWLTLKWQVFLLAFLVFQAPHSDRRHKQPESSAEEEMISLSMATRSRWATTIGWPKARLMAFLETSLISLA